MKADICGVAGIVCLAVAGFLVCLAAGFAVLGAGLLFVGWQLR